MLWIFVEIGTNHLHSLVPALPIKGLVGSSSMLIALFLWIPKYKHRFCSYEITQCALIDSIIESVGLSYAKTKQNPSQMLSKRHSMLSMILLPSTKTSITIQLLANSNTLLRQHGQTSFM